MKPDSNNIEQLAIHVMNGTFDEHVLHSLSDIACSPTSSQQFLKVLMANLPSPKGRPEDAVSGTMQILEKMADHSEQIS